MYFRLFVPMPAGVPACFLEFSDAKLPQDADPDDGRVPQCQHSVSQVFHFKSVFKDFLKDF
jgi:hypothetical protein